MAKLANNQFTINPDKNAGTLQIRADVCKCGATKCNYTQTVTAAITAINLNGDWDGDELLLDAASYPVSADGAADLEASIRVTLDGLIDDVEVVYTDTTTDTLAVTVTGSLIPLKNINGSGSFTVSGCAGTGN